MPAFVCYYKLLIYTILRTYWVVLCNAIFVFARQNKHFHAHTNHFFVVKAAILVYERACFIM